MIYREQAARLPMKTDSYTYYNMGDYAAHGHEGCAVSAQRIVLFGDVNLNVVTFVPPLKSPYPPVIFFPGMASVIDNFSGTIRGLTKEFTVHYAETREKSSSILPAKTGFEVTDIASDVAGVIDALVPEGGDYFIVAYSLCATAGAESFRSKLKKRPSLFVMIEPSADFRVPGWGIFLTKYFKWLYRPIKPLIKLYLRLFMVNLKEDGDMQKILVRILDTADPYKLGPTLAAAARYSLWDALDKIDAPVLVIGASHDTFHEHQDSRDISERIRGAAYVDMVNNKRTHSPEVAESIKGHLRRMGVSDGVQR
jgi:pimeloyl-ACP methyl ester carboxylesterase